MVKRNLSRASSVVVASLLFFGAGVAHSPIHAQQAANASGPTMEETMQFIQDHILHRHEISAYQRTTQDQNGYFGGDWAEREGFTIDSLAYDPATKSIVYTGSYWDSDGDGGEVRGPLPRPEASPYTLSIPLPKVKLDEVELEHNPDYEEFKSRAQIRDKDYPFTYSCSPEWLIVFGDGYENDFLGAQEIGLPVESEAVGQRVLKAVLHAIDLAGGHKAEPF
jgi:hypothetical protein